MSGAPIQTRSGKVERLVVLGYILAVMIPPLGVLFGLGASIRPGPVNRRHATIILAVALVACVVWVLVLRSGAVSNSSDTSY